MESEAPEIIVLSAVFLWALWQPGGLSSIVWIIFDILCIQRNLTSDGEYMASIVKDSGHEWDDFFIFAASTVYAGSGSKRHVSADDIRSLARMQTVF